MGRTASVELPRRIYDFPPAHPGSRKAVSRGNMDGLRRKGQAGLPPSVATDAQLGYSGAAYQSAELVFGQRAGGGRVLARPEGTRTRAHKAGESAAVTRRAKVGYCTCRNRPTHIAAPPRYVAGELPPLKARGASLWMEHGPWAAGFSTASHYAQDWGCLPSVWGWGAQCLNARAPPLPDGAFRVRAWTQLCSAPSPCARGG